MRNEIESKLIIESWKGVPLMVNYILFLSVCSCLAIRITNYYALPYF
jgi:hypothetical protein